LEALEDRTLPSVSPAGPILDLNGLTVNTSAYSSSDILVTFQPGVAPAAYVPGTALGQALGLVPGLYKVQVAPGVSVTQAVAAYRALPGVQNADLDYQLRVAWIPNDPLLSNQWYLNNTGQQGGTPGADIHAPLAWGTIVRSKVVIAVMDTGIDYNNPDLYLNIWINQAEIPKSRLVNLVDVYNDGYISMRDLNNPINQGPGKITDLNHDGRIDAGDLLAPMVLNAQGQDTGLGGWAHGSTQDGDTAHPDDLIGWNANANNNNPIDQNGHGTAVAGIIGASGNNGVGVAGVAWFVQLMPVQFMDAGGNGSISQFINGLNYSIAHGARITNNSWSGAPNVPSLYNAIVNAQAHGQIFVCAAGNDGANLDASPEYPAAYNLSNVVSVAATDNHDNLAGFSAYGAHTVSLAAPGVAIYSTALGNGYGYNTGTSSATPQVTAVLALVWTLRPEWNYQQVIAQVLSTVDPLASLAGKTITGGRLDFAAAIKVPPRTPYAPVFIGGSGSKITGGQSTSGPLGPSNLHPADVTATGPARIDHLFASGDELLQLQTALLGARSRRTAWDLDAAD
jgi:subtilisin family serine protease